MTTAFTIEKALTLIFTSGQIKITLLGAGLSFIYDDVYEASDDTYTAKTFKKTEVSSITFEGDTVHIKGF